MPLSTRSVSRAAALVAGSLALAAVFVHLRDASRASAAETPLPVTVFDHARVAEGFKKGGVLFKDASRNYQIHTSRRDGPGEAELHDEDTDLFYIQGGKATFITGGKLVAPKVVGPGETRGSGVEGGEAHAMTKGDVIIVPRGTPHWFRDVKAPFTYYTVKVR